MTTADGVATTLTGTLSNAGRLVLGASSGLTLDPASTLTNTGIVSGGPLTGEGSMINDGAMCIDGFADERLHPTDQTIGLTVTGTAFYLPYSSGIENAVYAPTLDAGCRSLPDLTGVDEGELLVNVGWTLTADGSGPYVTGTTPLIEVAPTKTGTLYPTLIPAAISIAPNPATVTAGVPQTFTVTGPWPLSGAAAIDLTDRAAFTDAGQQEGALPNEFTFTAAGETELGATVIYAFGDGDELPVSATAPITVLGGAVDALRLSTSALAVRQGGSVTLQVGATDAFGNPIVVDPGDVTVTSSVPTDVIDGLTVTFPTASPHVLTVTVGAVSAPVTIEVEAAPVLPVAPVAPGAPAAPAADAAAPVIEPPLPATGSAGDLGGALLWAVVLLVAGAAVGLLRTRAE
ncbi:hypothetical protein OVN20_02025 [Microcella daejeonensis]|uniref:hypothetical protein n=1 Tax=Microcella daejeonensis TaxID=2994971 RepID=UPI0022710D92|nr:hypothetical protein [Microcella daejeonensis]WAB84375.1 hypothetical protein OVN20_02025 [Microcella daejeonensis]